MELVGQSVVCGAGLMVKHLSVDLDGESVVHGAGLMVNQLSVVLA